MTGPVTTEALVEGLARSMWEQSYAILQDASWDVALQVAKHIPDGQAASCLATVRSKAAEIVTAHFAPLLAAHQQVTAERDEARNPFGNFTPTVERIALLMGQVWLEAKGAAGDTVADFEEFAMLAPEDCADCCTVAKAVLAAVDPAKANERADAAEASLATATSELARLRAEGEELKADRDDAIRMLDVWFDTSTKTNEQVVPQLVNALVGYLRTCRCGGMPAETSDMIEAGAADFIRRRAGYIIAPVIEAMVAERTASLRAEGEAKDRALQDALKAAIRAWSAKLHIPVTRMMSRELRAEFSTALARAATAREG